MISRRILQIFRISLFMSMHKYRRMSNTLIHNMKRFQVFFHRFAILFEGSIDTRLCYLGWYFKHSKGKGSGLKKKSKARAYFIRKNAKLKSKWLIKKKEGKRHQGVENISQARRAKRIKSQTLPVNLETLSLELSKLSLSSSIEIVWMKMSIRF